MENGCKNVDNRFKNGEVCKNVESESKIVENGWENVKIGFKNVENAF